MKILMPVTNILDIDFNNAEMLNDAKKSLLIEQKRRMKFISPVEKPTSTMMIIRATAFFGVRKNRKSSFVLFLSLERGYSAGLQKSFSRIHQ